MRTADEYIDKLKSMKTRIYLKGEPLQNFWDHPQMRAGINTIALTYELANDPKRAGLMTATSHISGKKINRFCHIHQSNEDLMKKVDMTREYARISNCCVQRCMGIDGMNAVSVATYDIDKEFGTNYHQRFLKRLAYFQENDMTFAGSMTDVKGDRSLRPHQQADPDMYVRIVERNSDGIVIRGAKAHNTCAPYADELLVMPTRVMTKEDADYAVCCSVPADAPGVIQIVSTSAPSQAGEMERPASCRYCLVDSISVFDNVFVPWERVFMSGEWQFAGQLAGHFANYHRHSYTGCKPATSDILVGASALVADYNGIEKASHIRDKLIDMAMTGEMIYACGIASSMRGVARESGTYYPDQIFSNAGKYFAGINIHHEYEMAQDIAGGLIATIPPESSFDNPDISGYLEKYLKGRDGIPTERRVRAFMLLEDLTVSKWGGSWAVASIHGGGSPMAEKIAIGQNYDFELRKNIAKRLGKIEDDPAEVAANAERKSRR